MVQDLLGLGSKIASAQGNDERHTAPEEGQAVYPHTLHAEALKSVEKARKMHMQMLANEPPSPRHTKVGLGVAIASLAAAALDPTRQAGMSFYNSYKNGLAQNDQEENQARNQKYLMGQQRLQAQEQFANQDANQGFSDARDLAQQQAAQAQFNEKRRQFDISQQDKRDASDRSQDVKDNAAWQKDIEGYARSIQSGEPLLRKFGVMGMRAHLLKDPDKFKDNGYDPKAMHDYLDEVEKTPTVKEAKGIEGAKGVELANQGRAEKIAEDKTMFPFKVADAKGKVSGRADQHKIREQQLNNLKQRYAYSKIIAPLKVQEAQMNIDKAHAYIAKMARGPLSDDSLKKLKAYAGTIKDSVHMFQSEINIQNGIIKGQTKMASRGDANATAAIKDARAKIEGLEKSHSYLLKQSQIILEKIKKKTT